MSFKGNINLVECSPDYLDKIAQEKFSIRAGSTTDPISRATQYEYEGYSGTMYFAKTSNMEFAENKLLQYKMRYNIHLESNAPNDHGYVYVIN